MFPNILGNIGLLMYMKCVGDIISPTILFS